MKAENLAKCLEFLWELMTHIVNNQLRLPTFLFKMSHFPIFFCRILFYFHPLNEKAFD